MANLMTTAEGVRQESSLKLEYASGCIFKK